MIKFQVYNGLSGKQWNGMCCRLQLVTIGIIIDIPRKWLIGIKIDTCLFSIAYVIVHSSEDMVFMGWVLGTMI